jgi:hypothetical protein
MAILIRTLCAIILIGNLPSANAQEIPKPLNDKIDAIIVGAYEIAAAQFPCKIGTTGKFRMMRWQSVDRCLNGAAERVDWEGVSKQLEALRVEPTRVSINDFAAAVDVSLSSHAIPYERLFKIKDDRALMPLTNSLLRFLPADSLHDVAVIDKSGSHVGTFFGVYSFERQGGLATANTYRLTLFQYTDNTGNVQSATDRLLLDSFGVPWKDARSQPGYRLTADKLNLKR